MYNLLIVSVLTLVLDFYSFSNLDYFYDFFISIF